MQLTASKPVIIPEVFAIERFLCASAARGAAADDSFTPVHSDFVLNSKSILPRGSFLVSRQIVMRVISLCVALALFGGVVSAADSPAAEIRNIHWKYIRYPAFLVPGETEQRMEVMVSCGESSGAAKPQHLRFDIRWTGPPRAKPPSALADSKNIAVRLHLPEATVESKALEADSVWEEVGNAMSATYSRIYTFPWARNRLDEAWIELRLPNQTFWVEIPYGFVRNPADALPPAESERGVPQLAPAMKDLAKSDQVVPWAQVEYELGEIPNHWKLFANIANPFRAAAEVTLYHDPGDNRHVLTLDEPRTAIALQSADGEISEGEKVASRYANARLGRVDIFRFGGGGENGREWGTLMIQVDDKRYGFTVPSSLFKYVHGRSDPDDKQQRLPLTRPPLQSELFHLLLRATEM